MKKMGPVGWVVIILLVIGGLNWGLIGAFNFDLVTTVFVNATLIRIIDILVGLAALIKLVKLFMKPKMNAPATPTV